MTDLITQIGVLGVFALLVIDKLITALRHKNSKNNHHKQCYLGTEVSKVRHRELSDLIRSVNENISAQTKILTELCKECWEMNRKLNGKK